MTESQFFDVRDNEPCDVHVKRVTLDPSTWSKDKLTVVEVMGTDSLTQLADNEEYSGKKDKEL